MRELTSHKVNGVNTELTVIAVDGPGPGGASQHYLISGYTHVIDVGQALVENSVDLFFQNGADGVNGITNEVLIAVLIDRLEGFQSGKFANVYNNAALLALKDAQHSLHLRTKERVKRGVEGKLVQ